MTEREKAFEKATIREEEAELPILTLGGWLVSSKRWK